jgi:hypothetical protein
MKSLRQSQAGIMSPVLKTLILSWLMVSAAGCRTPRYEAPRAVSELNAAGETVAVVRLNDLNSLVVRRRDEDRTVVVEIAFADQRHIVKRHTVGNAWVERGFIQTLNLGRSNDDPEYLVRVPDRSSTFGAETGIIVYRLQWWEFLLIPDDRFTAEDIDGDGVVEIKCERIQKKVYSLARGVLHEKKSR